MITGNYDNIDSAIDLSVLGISFSAKPILVGGLAMEYYGLRKHGDDIDFIVTDGDYRALAVKYPEHTKDVWANLIVTIGQYEMIRSISWLGYD